MVFNLFQVWWVGIDTRLHNLWHNSERLTNVSYYCRSKTRGRAGLCRISSFILNESRQSNIIRNSGCQWNVDGNMPYMSVTFAPKVWQVILGATTPVAPNMDQL